MGECRMRIPAVFMGSIIGKGGERVKNLQDETGCGVRIAPKDGSDTRGVVLTKNVKDGLDKLIDIMTDELENSEQGALSKMEKSKEFTVQCDVAPNQVGAVIGKAGQRASELREASQCNVKIRGEGQVILTGTIENIGTALQMLWESLESIDPIWNNGLGSFRGGRDDYNSWGSGINRYSSNYRIGDNRYQGKGGYDQFPAGPEIEAVLHLPDDTVGMLIGKRGDTISLIRHQNRDVNIEISGQAEEASNEDEKPIRRMTLRGGAGATARCHAMIAGIIEEDALKKKRREMKGKGGKQ